MGYADFRGKNFLAPFPWRLRDAARGPCGRGHAEARRIVHAASFISRFLIFCNQLSPESPRLLRPSAAQRRDAV
jgi:hypothetical protein